jgi:hypothetical protein
LKNPQLKRNSCIEAAENKNEEKFREVMTDPAIHFLHLGPSVFFQGHGRCQVYAIGLSIKLGQHPGIPISGKLNQKPWEMAGICQ